MSPLDAAIDTVQSLLDNATTNRAKDTLASILWHLYADWTAQYNMTLGS